MVSLDPSSVSSSPICVVSSSQMMTTAGWEDISNVTGHHAAPFQLYTDQGKTFIQVSQQSLALMYILPEIS